jgi:hypothetical protein
VAKKTKEESLLLEESSVTARALHVMTRCRYEPSRAVLGGSSLHPRVLSGRNPTLGVELQSLAAGDLLAALPGGRWAGCLEDVCC